MTHSMCLDYVWKIRLYFVVDDDVFLLILTLNVCAVKCLCVCRHCQMKSMWRTMKC